MVMRARYRNAPLLIVTVAIAAAGAWYLLVLLAIWLPAGHSVGDMFRGLAYWFRTTPP